MKESNLISQVRQPFKRPIIKYTIYINHAEYEAKNKDQKNPTGNVAIWFSAV